MDYHSLLPAQTLVFPKDVTLNEVQAEAINDALKDIRIKLCITYREQCYTLINLLHSIDTDKVIVPYDVIGKMFVPPRDHGSIIKEYQKYGSIRKAPHRPYLISDEEVEDIKAQLLDCEDYPSIEDISVYISIKFNKCPSRNTIKKIIKERIEGYKIILVKAIDDDRYNVTFQQIEEYYEELEKELKGVPVGFLFNLDESGQNHFVDAQNISIIVPLDVNIETYPVSRSIKRISLLHCISSDGTSCQPMVIVPRLTLDDEIFDEITTGSVLFAHQVKGFCTHELFTNWFMEKFIPYLEYKRDYYKYYGKCIIIMDGFAGHEKAFETLKNVLDEYKIKVIMIPPHSSDQVQPLDLFGFNLQKNKTAKFIFDHHYSLQTNTILAIIEGLNVIKSNHNVTTAWKMSGIFRTRNDKPTDPNSPMIQYHIVDMSRNNKIRATTLEENLKLHGSNCRRKKYKPLPPNSLYVKRKEIHLPTPADLKRNIITKKEIRERIEKSKRKEEENDLRNQLTTNPDCTVITDYFPLMTRELPNHIVREVKKKTKFRIAKLMLPDHFHVNNEEEDE